MSNLPKPKASTQDHLDVEDIRDDLVVLRTGWVALVMSTTAVNFDLLSEAEQDATIYAYGAFLNSLSFPVQTLIRSKKADITAYFQTLEEAEASQPNPDLKRQIQKYEDFIQATVQQKTVLDKKFYLIINYSPLEGGFKGIKKSSVMGNTSKGQLLEAAKAALAPKRDHVIKQTSRLGLSTRQLNSQELIELFYDIYNPAPTGTQRVLLDNASYTTPIVEPAIENPSTPLSTAGAVAVPEQTMQSVPMFPSGSVAFGSNQTNLRPAPTAPITYAAPVPSAAPITPVPTRPIQPVPPYQGQAGTNQAQALQDLQAAAAKAAQMVNVNPTTAPVAAPLSSNEGVKQ